LAPCSSLRRHSKKPEKAPDDKEIAEEASKRIEVYVQKAVRTELESEAFLIALQKKIDDAKKALTDKMLAGVEREVEKEVEKEKQRRIAEAIAALPPPPPAAEYDPADVGDMDIEDDQPPPKDPEVEREEREEEERQRRLAELEERARKAEEERRAAAAEKEAQKQQQKLILGKSKGAGDKAARPKLSFGLSAKK